jgi:hypothetical protein
MSKLFETKQDIERLLYNRNLTLEIRNRTLLLRDPESNEVMQLETIKPVNDPGIRSKAHPLTLLAIYFLIFLITVGVVHFISSQ